MVSARSASELMRLRCAETAPSKYLLGAAEAAHEGLARFLVAQGGGQLGECAQGVCEAHELYVDAPHTGLVSL